jgi:hypothetical protein
MRPTTLLLLVIAVLTASAASFAQSSSSSKALSPFGGDTGAIIRPSAPSFPGDPNSSWAKLNLMDSHPVCYTMRTYLVARDTPGSDSTHVAGYSECLPSWKLEMRTSEQKDSAAGAPAK